jgi:wobble nucleotide-excising tRNase
VTAKDSPTRKPGRPRKYPVGRPHATVRFTPARYAILKAEAEKNGRSLSEEVEARIERSFTDDVLTEFQRRFQEAKRKDAATLRALDRGEITIEQLMEEQDQRMAELQNRIKELESEKALSKDAIEDAIERGLARLFAKIGEIK